MTDRRAFLKSLARGAAYAAPVVASFGVPLRAIGQGTSSQHKPSKAPAPAAATQPAPIGGPAPGSQPPPGR